MNGAFHIGATGLRAQERALGIAANNIANMNTPGFKRSQIRFGELMAAPAVDPLSTDRHARGGGVSALAATAVLEAGEIRRTGEAMDVAIDGDGFLEVLGPEGRSLLWRGGALSLGQDGLLSTADGLPLRALITVPEDATDLTIARDGTVTARLSGETAVTELGRLDLVRVTSPQAMEALGGGLYRHEGATAAASVPGETGVGEIVQGAIESSNVALSNEMVSLMLMQRAYAASAQVLQAGDQLMGIANGLRR